jgi:hypothetical protein
MPSGKSSTVERDSAIAGPTAKLACGLKPSFLTRRAIAAAMAAIVVTPPKA